MAADDTLWIPVVPHILDCTFFSIFACSYFHMSIRYFDHQGLSCEVVATHYFTGWRSLRASLLRFGGGGGR